jgi:hypothetical protein
MQYFLWWIHDQKPNWIDENIELVVPIVAPFLGATKLIRTVVSGDARVGLDLFLSAEEARRLTRYVSN